MNKIFRKSLSFLAVLVLASAFLPGVQGQEGATARLQVQASHPGTVDLWQLPEALSQESLNDQTESQLTEAFPYRQAALNSDFQASFDGLAPGDYYGRIQPEDPGVVYQSFLLVLEPGQAPYQVQPKYKTAKGQLLLTKVGLKDGDSLPLEGVGFRLYEAGTHRPFRVLEGRATTDLAGDLDLVTDPAGQVQVEDLPPGDYYALETAPLPGYQPLDEPVTFTIEANRLTQVQVDNLALPSGDSPRPSQPGDPPSLQPPSDPPAKDPDPEEDRGFWVQFSQLPMTGQVLGISLIILGLVLLVLGIKLVIRKDALPLDEEA